MPHSLSELSGLFAIALLAASVLPLQSELVFGAMLLSGRYEVWALLLAAGSGNTLGACLNWWLGRYLSHYQDKAWFPVRKPALIRAEQWFRRWGVWVLLFSWVPVIGDPLTVMAGMLRMRFSLFISIVALTKTARYLALAVALHGV